MPLSDRLSAAIRHIHEAPLSSAGWSVALGSIAAAVDSDWAFLWAQNEATRTVEIVAGYGVPQQQLPEIEAAARRCRLPAWADALPAGVVLPSSSAISDREFARTPFYTELIRPIGGFYGIGVAPFARGRGPRVYLTAGRRLGRDDYDLRHSEVMQALVPHLATALQVGHRLGLADLSAAGAWAALDRLDTGVIVVDASARPLFANKAGETALSGRDGLGVDRIGLRTADGESTRALRRLVAGCALPRAPDGARGAGGTLDVPRGAGRSPLRLLVAPAPADPERPTAIWLDNARPAALVIVGAAASERDRRPRKEDLVRRFGLTPTEAQVALEMVRGDGRKAAAARLGVAETTIRTHLSHVFEKTGVRRQAELVRLLLESERDAGAPPLPRPPRRAR